MQTVTRQRDHTLDALKLFAIFLVLWGHAIQYFLPTNYYDEPVYRIIYSFHMPLFMALVGYFAASLLRLSLRDVLLKKGRQLLLPAFSFGLIFVARDLIYRGGVNGEWRSAIVVSLYDEVHCFWFLKSAFVCSLLYYLSFRYIPKPLVALVVSLVVSQCGTHVFRLPLMYPSFLLGVWIKNHNGRILSRPWRWVAASGVVFGVLLLFWDASFWRNPHTYELLCWYLRAYRVAIGFAGTIFFYALFRGLSARPFWHRLFDKICVYGQETLGVYLLQVFIVEMVLAPYLDFSNLGFVMFNFVVAPAISVAVLVVCLWIITLLRRSRICAFMFLGAPLGNKQAQI